MGGSRAPGLLLKTLAVTFLTVFVLLVGVFGLVTMRVHGQVRDSVTASLEASERLFSQLETRRQNEVRATAASVAENPTLKAALDTYTAELRTSTPEVRVELLRTIAHELDKVASTQDADAIVLADAHMTIMAASGRMADRWPRGRPVPAAGGAKDSVTGDSVAQISGTWFRLVSVPLVLDDGSLIGTLYLASSLDRQYADDLKRLFRADTAIVSDGIVLATTLRSQAAKQFEAALSNSHDPGGQLTLDGESYAYRRLVQIGSSQAGLYALDSIDEASQPVLAELRHDLLFIAAGAILVALLASVWLAHLVTKP
ncbi:MAG TPA: cache domain-containing protein, partial [Vicinamibacterales bacterium]|nr:cache domain-containing protein [Vicinamibacterales bacterium]